MSLSVSFSVLIMSWKKPLLRMVCDPCAFPCQYRIRPARILVVLYLYIVATGLSSLMWTIFLVMGPDSLEIEYLREQLGEKFRINDDLGPVS